MRDTPRNSTADLVTAKSRRRRRDVAILLAYLIPTTLVLFGGPLFQNEAFVFRDAGYWYFPLWHYVEQSWDNGIPKWNPLENNGTPIIEDATSLVFYPPKLLLRLPFNYATSLAVFLTAHWWLAAIGMYYWARCTGRSAAASLLAAASYTLSGSVLSQIANPIYLCSAAWLPLATWTMERQLKSPTIRDSILLAFISSMFLLGGDPQTCYHLYLFGCLLLGIAWWRKRDMVSWRYLTASAVLTLLLSSPQILPSSTWTAGSLRNVYDSPRCLSEIPGYLSRRTDEDDRDWRVDFHTGMLAAPEAGTTQIQSYEFSVGPWRWPEVLIPNFSGRLYPTNHRWMSTFHMEGRVWSPTIYAGCIPLLLAVYAARIRNGGLQRWWLTWMFLFGCVTSLGWFGLGWLFLELQTSMGARWIDSEHVGPQVGGVYWLLSTLLPVYGQFRYPAKCFIWAALAVSLLSAHGWDHVFRGRATAPINAQRHKKLSRLASLCVVGTCLMGIIWWIQLRHFQNWLTSQDTVENYFGTLSQQGAIADLFSGLAQALLMFCTLLALLKSRQLRVKKAAAPQYAFLILCIVEVIWANQWLLISSPTEFDSSLAKQLSETGHTTIYRTEPDGWHHHEYTDDAAVVSSAQWEAESLLPKYNLLHGIHVVHSPSSIESADRAVVWMMAQTFEDPSKFLAAIGADWTLTPTTKPIGVATNQITPPPGTQIGYLESSPRAWIVRNIRGVEPLHGLEPSALYQRTEHALISNGKLRDFRHGAIVECTIEHHDEFKAINSAAKPSSLDDIDVQQPTTDSLIVKANLPTAGLLVIRDSFHPGWTAKLKHNDQVASIPIWRANRIMRGILLPAGESEVVLQFQPFALTTGLLLGGVSWVVSLVVLVVGFVFSRRHDD